MGSPRYVPAIGILQVVNLDDLDRRIVGALQVDGRASWRRIADALDAPFTTVTRRGTALLASDAVRVVALPAKVQTAIIEVETVPARVEAVAHALAQRPGTIFVYALSAPTRIIVEELQTSEGTLSRAVLDEIPGIEGVTGVMAAPILDYFRTLASWMPGLLTASEVDRLDKTFGRRPADAVPLESDAERLLFQTLAQDGRIAVADIATRLGQSEPAVRRKLSMMVGTKIDVRTVVLPALLGLNVSAFLWIRVRPNSVDDVAAQLLASPFVRYAAMTMGDHQLIVDVAVPTLDDLRRFLTDQSWADAIESIRTSPVLKTYKISGINFPRNEAVAQMTR